MHCAIRYAGTGRLSAFTAALLLAFFFFASTALAAQNATQGTAPAATQNATKNDNLGHLWSARADDISALADEADGLIDNAGPLARTLGDDLKAARERFARLSSLYHASRSHPTEQLTLVEQMHTLQAYLKKRLAPLEDIAANIKTRLDEISALQKDMSGDAGQGGADAMPPGKEEPEGAEQQDYSRALDGALRKLLPASVWMETVLTPAKLTVERIDHAVAEIEKGLVAIWEDYYLTSSENNLSSLASSPALLTDWVTSLGPRMSFAWPQSWPEWLDAGKSFFLWALFMGGLGFFGLQGGRSLPQHWRHAVEGVIKGSWIWVGLGLALLAASTNASGGMYFSFVMLGSLIIIGGVAALSWRLRIALIPSLEASPSPLARLYPPAAIGVLMLFSDLPTRVLGMAWGLCMLAFLVMLASLRRAQRDEAEQPPLLERLSYAAAFWFGVASLIMAVAGYARLAILLFMALFALVNTITLGSALTALLDTLADRIFSKSTEPVRNALARAVSVPVACVLSLACTLPWIWAVPGARYLLVNALSANYTVGEASFDFSRLLIIALLFFLFRSFVSLGKASLDHLPERLPSMERGVIPPLRTLMTYGIWALFAIIALGMLGVNFTSLAVVAGGLSVGIGFGMQNIFNNLVSGLMLIFGRTILVGDYVEVAGAAGTVREISIRSTTIETPERALIYVPNSAIMAGQFVNWTRNSRIVRRSLNVGVAYGSDTALAARLLMEAARAHDHVLQFPEPAVIFNNFGDSSLDFTLNVFIDDFNNAVSALSELRFAVERLFDEHGIDIPFPQLTLHMPPGQRQSGGGNPIKE